MSKKRALMALALVVAVAVLFSGCIHRGPGWHPGYKELIPHSVSDGSGGVFVGWEDENVAYAQRVDSSGNLRWGSGLALNTLRCQYPPRLIEDGSGGAIVVWGEAEEKDGGVYERINYAQRIGPEGELLWEQRGRLVPGLKGVPCIVSDGSGGAIIVSMELDGKIKAQRMDQHGEPMWSEDGITIRSTCSDPGVLADGSGGAIIVWPDQRVASGRYDIYAQRISAEGEILWQEGGIPVCVPQHAQTTPKIVSDGSDGAIVAWPGDGVRIQRLSPYGEPLWDKEGMQLGALSQIQIISSPSIRMIPDNTGGAIVAWNRQAQRVNSEGELQWAEPMNLSIGIHSITDDGSSGAIIAGDSPKKYGHSPRAQRINSYGEPMWGEGGVQLFTGPQADFPGFMYSVVSDNSGGAILVANTGKYVAYWDTLYAQKIDSQGKVLWGDEGVQIWPE
jgi:hypothetical protein